MFIKTSKLRDSDLDRKFNIDYVTESVGKADDNLRTNLRVKGPWSGNLCPRHADTLRPQQPPPHVGPCPPGQQRKESPRTGDVMGVTVSSLANEEMPSLQKSILWRARRGEGTVEFKHPWGLNTLHPCVPDLAERPKMRNKCLLTSHSFAYEVNILL